MSVTIVRQLQERSSHHHRRKSYSFTSTHSQPQQQSATKPQHQHRQQQHQQASKKDRIMAQITRIGNPLSDSRRYHHSLPCYHQDNSSSWRSQWWVWALAIAVVLCSWSVLTENYKNRNALGKSAHGAAFQKEYKKVETNASSRDFQGPSASPKTTTPLERQQHQPKAHEETDDDPPSTMINIKSVGNVGSAVEHAVAMSSVKPTKQYTARDWNSVATKRCFTQGVSDTQRQGSPVDMKLPTAIVLGEGTQTLYHYINQHKDLAAVAADQKFLDDKIDAWVLKSRSGIPRKDTRAAYAKSMNNAILNPEDKATALPTASVQPSKLFMDWSPSYLFHSDKVPSRIQCIVPWVKFIGILQNPIDRALAQYQDFEFNVPEGKKPISFEDYVLADIGALMETGVLQDWTKVRFDEFAGSSQEQKAWRAYTMSGVPGPVGRGLYSIMIQQYLEALPDNEFLFMPSEDWNDNAQESYRVVLEYLGLGAKVRANMIGDNAGDFTMTAADRRTQFVTSDLQYILQHLYEPYNRRLETLLGKEWAGIWKETTSKNNGA